MQTAHLHRGVTCDGCGKRDFLGLRHKCEVCRDYDLCHDCFMKDVVTKEHKSVHAVTTLQPPLADSRIESVDSAETFSALATDGSPQSQADVLRLKSLNTILRQGQAPEVLPEIPPELVNYKFGHAKETLLHAAVAGGDARSLKQLLERGCDPNVGDGKHMTPLHDCILLYPPDDPKRLECAKILIAKTDLHRTWLRNLTYIKLAVHHDNLEVCKWLCEAGGRTDVADEESYLPIHTAASSQEKNADKLLEVLVAHGSPLDEENGKGQTPLQEACYLGNFYRALCLMRAGCVRKTAHAESGITALHYALHALRRSWRLPQLPKQYALGFEGVLGRLLALALEKAKADEAPKKLIDEGIALDVIKDLIRSPHGCAVNVRDSFDNSPLEMAVRTNGAIVKVLLEAGAEVNDVDAHQRTALIVCLAGGPFDGAKDIVKLLLDAGADVHVRTKGGSPALVQAARFGPEVVGLLLEAGASVNAVDKDGDTVLHTIAYFLPTEDPRGQTLQLILRAPNASVTLKNNAGQTPLTIAMTRQWPHMPNLLLLLQKRMSQITDDRFGLYKIAVQDMSEKDASIAVAAAVAAGAKPDAILPDMCGNSPVHVACQLDYGGTVVALVKAGVSPVAQNSARGRLTPLDFACNRVAGSTETRALQALLSCGLPIDLDAPVANDLGPLLVSINQGLPMHTQMLLDRGASVKDDPPMIILLLSAIEKISEHDTEKEQLLRMIIKAGNPNQKKLGITALHAAVATSPLAVRLLIEAGANLEVRDEADSKTPLHGACNIAGSVGLECVKILVDAGADIEAKTCHGSTPLRVAARQNPEAALFLLERGANVFALSHDNSTVLHAAAVSSQNQAGSLIRKILQRAPELLEAQDNDEDTPLGDAIKTRTVEGVRMLLAVGANVNAIGKRGNSKLYDAVQRSEDDDDTIVKLLLQAGANPNIQNDFGYTPLHWAASKDYVNVCKTLLKYKADISLLDKEHRTCVDVAKPQAAMILFAFVHEPISMRSDDSHADNDHRNDNSSEEGAFSQQPKQFSPAMERAAQQQQQQVKNAQADFAQRLQHDVLKVAIPFEAIVLGPELGRGSFGVVHRSEYRGMTAAAKVISLAADPETQRQIIAEIRVATGLFHNRVVQCYGVSLRGTSQVVILMELMKCNLSTALETQGTKFSHRQRMEVALHVLEGLTFLHTNDPPIVHRDLKPDNILLNSHMEAKLSDFGLAQVRNTATMSQMARCGGTLAYMSTEVAHLKPATTASDVFSMGMVLLELFTGKFPWGQVSGPAEIVMGLRSGNIPLVTDSTVLADGKRKMPKPLGGIINKMLAVKPEDRPTAHSVLIELKNML